MYLHSRRPMMSCSIRRWPRSKNIGRILLGSPAAGCSSPVGTRRIASRTRAPAWKEGENSLGRNVKTRLNPDSAKAPRTVKEKSALNLQFNLLLLKSCCHMMFSRTSAIVLHEWRVILLPTFKSDLHRIPCTSSRRSTGWHWCCRPHYRHRARSKDIPCSPWRTDHNSGHSSLQRTHSLRQTANKVYLQVMYICMFVTENQGFA